MTDESARHIAAGGLAAREPELHALQPSGRHAIAEAEQDGPGAFSAPTARSA